MAVANNPSLMCCVPMSDVCSMQPILRTTLFTMVKVDCTSASCTESGFIHPNCFYKLEESLIRYVSTYQWSNSHKQETMKKYNWSVDYVRENLWKTWIYNLISKKLNCNCGSGYLRKDLVWPPTNWRKNTKKSRAKPKDYSTLPQLNHVGGKVRYVPSVVPEYPTGTKISSGSCKSIPGAVFAEKEVIKRGLIVMWSQGVGQVRNMDNEEERLCVAREEVVEGGGRDMERMVGSEVEYKTKKRGKKLEAVMVRLVKKAEWRKGMVTHWVPEELAGVIKSDEEEVLVYRSEFVPGGFAPDIVGKIVKFKLDRAKLEATCVQVEHEQVEDGSQAIVGNIAPKFSELDLVHCPLLAQAVSEDSSLVRDMGNMSDREQRKLMDQLEQFLPTLAVHPVGYKVVVEMVRQFQGMLMDRVVRILSREFIFLSQLPIGAKCLLDCLASLPMELKQCIVHAYSDMTNYQEAVHHLTGLNSYPVFKVSLYLMDTSLLRQLVIILAPGLASLVGHPSLTLLVDHADQTDPQVLFLLASQLDAEHLLLHHDQSVLVIQLVMTGNVRVCGLVLHNMSGRMDAVLNNEHGRDLVTAFIWSATDLQVELVMEELCQEQDAKPPIIMQLAVGCSKEDGLMEAVVTKARREVLNMMLDIFKQFKDRMISSDSGKRWISCISRKVNSDCSTRM